MTHLQTIQLVTIYDTDNSTGNNIWYTQLQTLPSIGIFIIFPTSGFVAAFGSSSMPVTYDPWNSAQEKIIRI